MHSAPSTTLVGGPSKIRTHPRAHQDSDGAGPRPAESPPPVALRYEWRMSRKLVSVTEASPTGRALHKLFKRDRRKALPVTVKFRGGSEAWWEITARGVTVRVPGHTPIHEVLDRFTGTI